MHEVTHATIDGEIHKVASVQRLGDSERVYLGCGITVDVGDGWRESEAAGSHVDVVPDDPELLDALAAAGRAEDDAERLCQVDAPSQDALDRRDAARVAHARANRAVHDHRRLETRRWLIGVTSTCKTCVGVEAGAAPVAIGAELARPKTIKGDIPTGISCDCGSLLYIKRDSGLVVCAGYGHEFSVPEVLASTMRLLQRLAKGEV